MFDSGVNTGLLSPVVVVVCSVEALGVFDPEVASVELGRVDSPPPPPPPPVFETGIGRIDAVALA